MSSGSRNPMAQPRGVIFGISIGVSAVLSVSGLAGRVCLDDTRLVCEHDRLDAVAEAQFLEDVRDVCLDGRLADVEPLPDLCVGKAGGDEPKDVLLSCGEFVELFGRNWARDPGELFDYAFGDRG